MLKKIFFTALLFFHFLPLFAGTDADDCNFLLNPNLENLVKVLPYLSEDLENKNGYDQAIYSLGEILRLLKLEDSSGENLEKKMAIGLFKIQERFSEIPSAMGTNNLFHFPGLMSSKLIKSFIDDFNVTDLLRKQAIAQELNKLISMGFLGMAPERIGLINFKVEPSLSQATANNFLASQKMYDEFKLSIDSPGNLWDNLGAWEDTKRRISALLYSYNRVYSDMFTMNSGYPYQVNKLPYLSWADFKPFALVKKIDSVSMDHGQNKKKYFFEIIKRVKELFDNITTLKPSEKLNPGVVVISDSDEFFKPLALSELVDLMTSNKRLPFNIPSDFKILEGQLSFYEWALSMSHGIMPIASTNIRVHDLAHLAEFYTFPERSMKPVRSFYNAIFNPWYKFDSDGRKITQTPLALKVLKKMGYYTDSSITKLDNVSLAHLQLAVGKLELIPDLFNESIKTRKINFENSNYPYTNEQVNSGDLNHNIALLIPVFNEVSTIQFIEKFSSVYDRFNYSNIGSEKNKIIIMIKSLFNEHMPIHVLGGDSNDGVNATRRNVKNYNFAFITDQKLDVEKYALHVNRFPDVAFFNLSNLSRLNPVEIENILSDDNNINKVVIALKMMKRIIDASKKSGINGPQDFIFNLYAEKLDENNPSLKYLSEGYDIHLSNLVEYFSTVPL